MRDISILIEVSCSVDFCHFDNTYLVAGPGIEPGSSGYEPDEVPLLYPAIFFDFKILIIFVVF